MGLLGGVTQLLGALLDPIIRGVTLLLMELLGGVTQLLGGGRPIISAIIRGGSPPLLGQLLGGVASLLGGSPCY